MKNKLIILLFILGCFTLMGCPPAHYYHYEYVGKKSLGTDRGFSQLEFDELTHIEIRSGFYYQFIGKKERGLATQIRIKKNENFDLFNSKVKVMSSKLGELKKRELSPDYLPFLDSVPTLIFDRQIELKSEDKILKLIEKDTITVEFSNGMKYQFVKR